MLTEPATKLMNVKPLESEPDDQPQAATRYTYASGSRPLEGYTVKRGVGRGGFGEVYFALSDAGKEVALKLIRRNMDIELRGVTHCLNLKHPNLIALYDIRSDDLDDRWVVMEYVSGESLEDAIEKHPNGMPLDLAMKWFAGMTAGVAHLHDHGIVHRDLKPANIFMDQGTVKIGDYGLSKFISCSRRSGQTESVGTVHYMAPEIANGRYGKEIDTYALGIILYEMLTGHVPFEGESVGEVLMKHLTAEPDLDSLQEPFRGLVQSAMAKDPDARFSSIAAMMKQLPNVGNFGEGYVPVKVVETNSVSSPAANEGEPIIAGLKKGLHEAEESFRNSDMHPLLKSVLGVVIVIALVATSAEWLGLFMILGFCYLIYRAVRLLIVNPHHASSSVSPSMSPDHPLQGLPTAKSDLGPAGKRTEIYRKTSKKKRRKNWQQHLQNYLAGRTTRQRVTDLVGSMLLSAVVAVIASMLISSLLLGSLGHGVEHWLALTIMLSSWAVMIPGKLTEGRVEDQAPLRFTMLVLGALVGVVSWGIADKLMLSLPASQQLGIAPGGTLTANIFENPVGQSIAEGYSAGLVNVPLQIFVGYFALLFVTLAWWRQGDYARSSRVGLWKIVWCGLVAWMLHFVWWFPQPVGMLTAAATALTVQLSSPWMPPSRKRALSEMEV